MLVLAAKAAVIEIEVYHDADEADYEYRVREIDPENGKPWMRLWDPLTDDGDALRLAVKLRLDIDFMEDMVRSGFDMELIDQPFLCDPVNATRRVIVLAAAEIGRAMQCAKEQK